MYITKPFIIFLPTRNQELTFCCAVPAKHTAGRNEAQTRLYGCALLNFTPFLIFFIFLPVSGMRLRQWCIMGVTMLLLLCEIAVSQLCKSLITMVDGFHTLFILFHMALHQTEGFVKPCTRSSDSSPFSPLASSSSSGALPPPSHSGPPAELPPRAQSAGEQPHRDPAAPIDSQKHFSPAAPSCGLSFPDSRKRAVGVFISYLLLVSLCIAYFLEIMGFMVKPHPVHHPLLPVVVGAGSLLHKMLLFVLDWDELLDKKAGSCRRWVETEPHLEMNYKGDGSTDTLKPLQQ